MTVTRIRSSRVNLPASLTKPMVNWDPLAAERCRQMCAVLVGFDFQMKGEDWINSSVWPIQYQPSPSCRIPKLLSLVYL